MHILIKLLYLPLLYSETITDPEFMFKTYMRLLGFVSPISKYAVPYFFYALLYALFNTLTYAMILPIMNTLFDDKNSYVFQPVYDFPMHGLSFSDIDASQMLSYVYTQLFGTNFTMSKMLLLLACGTIVMNLLSNFFRYMSAWTVENMRVRSLQRMRNDLFNKIMGMNAGYFSDQRKGDLMSRITQDVMVVQYCITNTLQVAFRDPLLIIGYVIYMLLVSWQLSLFAILFLMFDVETVFLFSWAVVVQELGMYGLVSLLFFLLILVLGLAYAWRKGALEWK